MKCILKKLKTYFSNNTIALFHHIKALMSSIMSSSSEVMSILMLKASESLSALWYSQLEVINEKTGVSMDLLCNCFNLQVQMVPMAEKKKRAPPKKKGIVVEVMVPLENKELVDVEEGSEKKKRAPAKKKEAVPPEGTECLLPPEKKKRAPPKKKGIVVEVMVPLENKELVDVEEGSEKKKRAPAKKKEAKKKKTVADPDSVKEDEESCSGNTDTMKPDRIDVEEVVIGGSSFLVANDGRAYLKSSRQVVGNYDPTEKTMKPLSYDDNEEDASDDDIDECPVLSDLSDNDE
jgi:hypothetical protein